jgi:hypothetical protein
MAGEQQLHQLSIEQFVSQGDAQTEAKNGANAKFQEQAQDLERLAQGKPLSSNSPSNRGDSSEQVLDFGTADQKKAIEASGLDSDEHRMLLQRGKESAGEGAADGNIDKHFTLEERYFRDPSDSIIEKIRHWKADVTPEDRKEAKDALGKDISPLITDADSKTLKSMQEAIVDGNIGKLAETLKNMPPERAKAFIKELNKELKAHNAGVELSATGDGRVFVYETSGQTAIQINRDGTTTVKPIKHNYDGSIVVEPGEIINKDAEEVMKGISDTAVRGITGGNRIIWSEKPVPFIPRKPEHPRWPIDPEFPKWPKEDPIFRDPEWKPWLERKPETLEELLRKPYWMKQRENDMQF